MTKDKIIYLLTNMQVPTNDNDFVNGYNRGIKQALILIGELEESRSLSEAQILDKALRKNLTKYGSLTETDMDNLVYHLNKKEYLNAVKIYKDSVGIGLKEAKDQIDAVRVEIGAYN